MSTSTLNTLLTASIGTAWDYITSTLGTVLPFAVGIAVLVGGIYFILRRLHVFK